MIGIWFFIVLFAIVGALMLWQGMKGNDNRSCLADLGRLFLIFAWMIFSAVSFKSCIIDKITK